MIFVARKKNHAMENRVKENHVRRGIPVVIVLVVHVSTLIVAVPTFLMDLSWGILRDSSNGGKTR